MERHWKSLNKKLVNLKKKFRNNKKKIFIDSNSSFIKGQRGQGPQTHKMPSTYKMEKLFGNFFLDLKLEFACSCYIFVTYKSVICKNKILKYINLVILS